MDSGIEKIKKEYTVIYFPSISRLIKEVNEHINNGWELVGGIVVSGNSNLGSVFYQALIKQ